ncbi:hypothetical protein J4G37_28530 [Microvirga sp. 3-52]|nr:hypothetical protein [Microvirga sp. 3-52]
MDRQLERFVARAGQLTSVAKPVLEINSRHDVIVAQGFVGDGEKILREDAAYLMLDEALILDGELPVDAEAFSQRLHRGCSCAFPTNRLERLFGRAVCNRRASLGSVRLFVPLGSSVPATPP